MRNLQYKHNSKHNYKKNNNTHTHGAAARTYTRTPLLVPALLLPPCDLLKKHSSPCCPSGPAIMRSGIIMKKEKSSASPEVRKMKVPLSRKKRMTHINCGAPAPMVVMAPPMMLRPTPWSADVARSTRVPLACL